MSAGANAADLASASATRTMRVVAISNKCPTRQNQVKDLVQTNDIASAVPAPNLQEGALNADRRIWLALTCVALLCAYAVLAWQSSSRMSSTFDEPIYALSARVCARQFDFRLNPEHPPLWKYWAALGQSDAVGRPDEKSAAWESLLANSNSQWAWTSQVMYHSPGNDGEELVWQSRRMMLPIALLLGAMTCWWALKAAGATAAVVATGLFALDPNLIAHGALMTNDVSLALIATALAFLAWRTGQRASVWRGIVLGGLLGMALAVKFTAIFLPFILGILLVVRALAGPSWHVGKFNIADRRAKLLMAAILWLGACGVAYVVLWASYGFRYSPTANPSARFDMRQLIAETNIRKLFAEGASPMPSAASIRAMSPDLFMRTIVALDMHCLMPNAWSHGLLFSYMTTRFNPAFLNGKISGVGWGWYFPAAILYKTSLTMLALGSFFLLGSASRRISRNPARQPMRHSAISPTPFDNRWFWAVLALPPTLMLLLAMNGNFDVGLRHVLWIYPPAFIAIGAAMQKTWENRPRAGLLLGALIAAGLCSETACAFPDYLSFFNAAANRMRGGITLLGDSNLDWGQGLVAMAQWQKRHPAEALYLGYFGSVDPAFYGVNYVALPGGYASPDKPARWPDDRDRGVMAISATILQGIYLSPELRKVYSPLLNRPPREILGGSIWLFDWPMR